MNKLHLGCGWRNFGKDWIHIDGGDYEHLNYHNICSLPYEDNSVDLIYASHVIAYFDREEIVTLLREWKRVLKSGAKMRLATPDFEEMVKLYVAKDSNIENFLGPLYGKMKMGKNIIYHKTAYDFKSLKKTLEEEVGMKEVKIYNWRETEHSMWDDHSQAYMFPHMDKEKGTLISLNVECVK